MGWNFNVFSVDKRFKAIPNYGWEVVNHSMLLQLRAENIQNKD
jgi:hypothetical protein